MNGFCTFPNNFSLFERVLPMMCHTDDEQVQIKTDYKCSSILYDIIIDTEMWQRICPKSVIYKEHGRYNSTRQYSTLQRG